MYDITDYSFKQADKLGVEIKPSKNKKKKIDVYKAGKFVTAIGDRGMGDYPFYIKTEGKKYADERRRLYKIRHDKFRNIKDSTSFFADKILW